MVTLPDRMPKTLNVRGFNSSGVLKLPGFCWPSRKPLVCSELVSERTRGWTSPQGASASETVPCTGPPDRTPALRPGFTVCVYVEHHRTPLFPLSMLTASAPSIWNCTRCRAATSSANTFVYTSVELILLCPIRLCSTFNGMPAYNICMA